MKKLGIILIVTLIALVGLWIWVVAGSNQISQETVQQRQFAKQSSDQGEVIVEVTPVVLEPGREVKFNVVFDTHSVELNYDLLRVSSLSDDKGNNLTPISWSGGSGSHHLNGELVFPPLSAAAKSVQLVITGIAGFDRKFIWNF